MPQITIYTTTYCPFCDFAKALLNRKGIPYKEINVDDDEAKFALKKRTGWRTVPQIFIGEELIGGYRELEALERCGELERRLTPSSLKRGKVIKLLKKIPGTLKK